MLYLILKKILIARLYGLTFLFVGDILMKNYLG